MTSISGETYALRDWLTSYPLLLVALDPYTNESSWILETAGRLLDHFSPADIRVGWLVTSDEEGCRAFLAEWAEKYLVFQDPDRAITSQLQLEAMPSLLHIRADGQTEVANGWQPESWRPIIKNVSKLLAWSAPLVPQPGDPSPFLGTTA